MRISFADITYSTTVFDSEFDGFLGMAPYSEKPEEKAYNFLWQLQYKKKIDNMLFSVFVSNDRGLTSHIKFGDWDQSAIVPGKTLQMFKTNDINAWSLPAKDINWNHKLILTDVPKNIQLNPHLPYMYIPKGSWTHLAFNIQPVLPELDCSFSTGACIFPKSCDNYKNFDYPLSIVLHDGEAEQSMDFKMADILVPGGNFGDSDDKCYMTVFMGTKNREGEIWELGTIFFKKYYVVYDMTPYERE